MAEVLTRTGYEFFKPRGAFYFFPKSPIPDEVAFVSRLAEERVLGVPGRGFGLPGYFRLAFCVGEEVIARAEEGLARARAELTLHCRGHPRMPRRRPAQARGRQGFPPARPLRIASTW
jgi:aspartate/methionine/tyrosine aminotransferase